MKNFVFTLGIAGVVAGYAMYKIAKSMDNEEQNRRSKQDESKISEKTKEFESVLMNCQLTSLMKKEGFSLSGTKTSPRNGSFKALDDKTMHKIFKFCEISDLCKMKMVCKSWKDFLDFMLKDKEYLMMCAKRGFKTELRGKYWLLISNCAVYSDMEEIFLESVNYFDEENDQVTRQKHRDIEKDISRTLNRGFNIELEDKKEKLLKSILVKFCSLDKKVGYVQGMNFLAGQIISSMNENESFSFLRTLMFEYDVRSYFFKDLPRLKLSLYQFSRNIKKFLPVVHKHLRLLHIKVGMFASDWFLTIFTYSFPGYFSQRVWDYFLIGGWPILHSIAIALLKSQKDHFLDENFEGSLHALKKIDLSQSLVERILESAIHIEISGADLDLQQRKFVDNKLFMKIYVCRICVKEFFVDPSRST